MRIRHKLLLGSLLLSFLVGAVGFYATGVSRKSLHRNVTASSEELAAKLVREVDRGIHVQLDGWRAFVSSPQLLDVLEFSNKSFAAQDDVEEFLDRQDRQWVEPAGGEPFNPNSFGIDAGFSQVLSAYIHAFESHEGGAVYGEAFITNRFGANVAQTAKTSDYRQDDELWWQRALRTGVYVSDIHYDESADVYAIDLCMRIDDAQGRPAGVLKAVFDIRSLISTVGDVGRHSADDSTRNVWLLTADRRVIFSSRDRDIVLDEDIPYHFEFGATPAGATLSFQAEHGKVVGAAAFSQGFSEFAGSKWIVVVENDADRLMAPIRALRNNILLISAGVALVMLVVAGIFSLWLANRINTLREAAVELGRGNIEVRIDDAARDEIGDLAQSISRMAEQQHELARQADRIAAGDYSVRVLLRSEADELSIALNTMTANLQDVSQQNEVDRWIKTGQTELADVLRGESDPRTLCGKVIEYLAKYLDAQVGVVYLADSAENLHLTASYAYTRRKNPATTVKPGEGLVGQAAIERKPILITDVPADYVVVDSGLGTAPPRNLTLVPLVLGDTVKGVIELGSLKPVSKTQIELLRLTAENIAITINSVQDRETMGRLLIESQRQAEELQSQQEELKAANEELEGQTAALRDSREELKTQSEELQATNEKLRQKSKDLSRQKADIEDKNRQLEIAGHEIERKARSVEAASKYKSEFLANMSHELRTPLNSLLILAKSLANNEEGNLTGEQIQSARIIHEGGRDLLSLINDILDLSKVEAGKLGVHVEPVSMSSVTRRLLGQFNPIAQDKGIELHVDVDDTAPESLSTDVQRLEQILKNLLSNAMKFTESGSVTLRIAPADADTRFKTDGLAGQRTVAMSVIDTGIGISEESQKIIFDAFRQADGSTNRKFGGTGLGLAICRELAELLGGEIQVTSRRGQGSAFTLYLPVASARDDSAASSRKGAIGHTAEPAPAEKIERCFSTVDGPLRPPARRVLLVEDDKNFREALTKYVANKDVDVTAVATGIDAIREIASHEFECVILDVGLPDMTGLELLRSLRSEHARRLPPVVVYTGRVLASEEYAELSEFTDSIVIKGADSEERLLDEVSLFLHGDESASPEGQREISRTSHGPDRELKGRKVLLVDDDMRNTFALSRALHKTGLTVEMADNGKLGLEKLDTAGDFDLVVMDIMMPVMDGCETIRRIRAQKRFADLPIIALTARAMPEERTTCLDAGADDYMAKPVDVDQLLALMRTRLYEPKVTTA